MFDFMSKIPGVSSTASIRALRKAGFSMIRQGGHSIMSNGVCTVAIPRHNPINAFTMGHIAKCAGFTPEQFKRLL